MNGVSAVVIRSLAIAVAVLWAAPGAHAQSTTNPPGAVRGLFGGGAPPSPGRTTQQVSTWFDIGGGYDRNLDTSGAAGATNVEGLATTGVVNVRYWRGRATRAIEGTARLFRNDQRAGRTTATGGEVNVNGNAEFGLRGGVNMSLRAANDSAVLFGAFGPPLPAAPAPGVDIDVPNPSPIQGDVANRWISYGGNAGAHYNWTPRHRTSLQLTQLRQQPTEGDGVDSSQGQVSLNHDWMFRRTFGLIGSYRLARVQQTFDAQPEITPVLTQTAEAGFRYERRASPTRTLSLAVLGGAAQILSRGDAEGLVEPTGSFTASYSLTRRWLVSATATRGITVLQGTTQVPFINDLGSVSVTGVLSRRVTLVSAASISRGDTIGSAPGSFDASGWTTTVRYGFRYGALFAGYTGYEHRVRDLMLVPGAVAPRFNQRSVRAGVTIWLPLFGAF